MPVSKDQLAQLAGKKVRVATREFHHIVGRLEGKREEKLAVRVGDRELLVDIDAVVSLTEALPEEVEFVK